jgi:hypothetical protein
MTFATFHLFAGIISALACYLRRFNTLAIQNGSTRLSLTPFSQTQLGSESVIDYLPKTSTSPSMIIGRNDAVRRQITGQISPSTPISVEVKNGIEDFSPRIDDFSAQVIRARQEWLNDLPFQVTQISRVCCFLSHRYQFTASVSSLVQAGRISWD